MFNVDLCRVAVVTGASGHIGSSLVRKLLGENWAVIAVDYESATDVGNVTSVEGHLLFLPSDLESESDRNSTVKRIRSASNRLDALIHCAAFVGDSALDGWNTDLSHQSVATWRRAMEVNLTAPFHLTRDLAELLKKSEDGSVVNVASIYGEFGPDLRLYEGLDMNNPAAYAASKGGLIQLTKWLSTVLAPHVRVNAVSPGGVYRNQDPTFVQRYSAKVPLARMASEEDVVESILFLISERARYITGQVLRVDGGWGVW